MKRIGLSVAVLAVLVTLAACNSGTTNSTPPTPTATSVNGTVVGFRGSPISGVSVQIGSATTTTDTSGHFTIANVTPPYDVTVSDPTGTPPWVHAFEGMTSASPTLTPLTSALVSASTTNATFSGTITGGTTVDASHPVYVCAEAVSGRPFGCTTTASSSYSLTVRWFGSGSVQVKLHALQVTLAGTPPLPTGYPGSYVSATATTLASGDTPTEAIALSAGPTSSSLSGTVTIPIGYPSGQIVVAMQVGNALTMPLARIPLTSTSTSYPYAIAVPDVSGATSTLYAEAHSSFTQFSQQWKTGLTPGSNRDMTLSSAPVLVSPPNGSPQVPTTTDFSFVNSNGAPVTAYFLGGPPWLAVTTMSTSVKLPTAISIPSSTNYNWSVVANAGESGVDAAASDWAAGYLAFTSAQAALPAQSGGAAWAFSPFGGANFQTK